MVSVRLLLAASIAACGAVPIAAQERGPTPASPEQIRQAIGKRGDLDYTDARTRGIVDTLH